MSNLPPLGPRNDYSPGESAAPPQEVPLSSDFSLLLEGADEHPAYPAFTEEMKGRAYGRDALNDAWLWFRAGWRRAREALTTTPAPAADPEPAPPTPPCVACGDPTPCPHEDYENDEDKRTAAEWSAVDGDGLDDDEPKAPPTPKRCPFCLHHMSAHKPDEDTGRLNCVAEGCDNFGCSLAPETEGVDAEPGTP